MPGLGFRVWILRPNYGALPESNDSMQKNMDTTGIIGVISGGYIGVIYRYTGFIY